ncbi:DNA-binding response regulator [hydrothermal vent metagenome]|uniref:DNA-binding response regulator n=1 Tax=hydrothermal vent metagenome TaxID=652676 RepID=A0A1W1BDV6_9ZZZZ
MSPRILLLEDDKLFNETLQDFLDEEGYQVHSALDPYTALDLTYHYNFELYLFDVNLPYESGFDLLKKLRDSGDNTPTIFLTSRDDKSSLKEGFLVGADDYIKKPVDLDELTIRIDAILRRLTRTKDIKIEDFNINTLEKKIYKNNIEISVSKKVIELLILFISANKQVVLLDEIKNTLWTTSQESSDGSIRVYITQLKKLFPNNIENLRGIGYRFTY